MKTKHLPFIALVAMTIIMCVFEFVIYEHKTELRYAIPFVALAAGVVGAFTFYEKK